MRNKLAAPYNREMTLLLHFYGCNITVMSRAVNIGAAGLLSKKIHLNVMDRVGRRGFNFVNVVYFLSHIGCVDRAVKINLTFS